MGNSSQRVAADLGIGPGVHDASAIAVRTP